MSQNDNQSSTPDEQPHYFKDLSIRIFKNTYIRLFTIASIIGVCVTLTINYISNEKNKLNDTFNSEKNILDSKIDILKDELSSSKYNTEKLARDQNKLKVEKDELQRKVKALNQATRVPTLIYPVDNRAIIGKYVRFKWSYGVSTGFKNFVLELRRADPSGIIIARYPIPEGHKRREIPFQFPESMAGQFYWRIGTGELLQKYQGSESLEGLGGRETTDKQLMADRLDDTDSETRLWSRFGSFSIYESMWEKLKRTQKLVVGTTAAYLSYDHPVDCRGRPNNYDMDLIEKIAEKLEKKLKAEVKVEHDVRFWLKARKINKGTYLEEEKQKFENRKEIYLDNFNLNVVTKIIDWSDKFASVIDGDVDLTIANLTSSKTREKVNPGLKFSNGYRDNKQTLIASKLYPPIKNIERLGEKELIAALAGKSLAVQDTSTNMKAAEYLRGELNINGKKTQKIIDFVIDKNPYDSYVDVIDQVRSGRSQFGMIDSVRFESVDYPDLMRININLDSYLKELNRSVFGAEIEQYAIAFASHGGRNVFEYYLNQAIKDTEDDRKYLAEVHSNKTRKSGTSKSLGCERFQRMPWGSGL